MKRIFLISIVVFFVFGARSQKQIDSQFNSWWMYFGNHRVSERWGFHTEYQWRRSDFIKNWQQSLMRIGVDYYLPNKAQLTLGYGWIVTYPYGKQPIAISFNEHRTWQQLILQNQVGRFYFHHRYRVEQRFLENVTLNSLAEKEINGFKIRQRVRYRFMVNIPISKKELADNTLFLSLYDEPFLGFGRGIGKNILDQNRLYLAIGWRQNNSLNYQIGYLNQYIVKSNGLSIERNHTIQTSITYNIDLR